MKSLQKAVSDVVNKLNEQPAWWYGIHYHPKSPHSLGNFLGIDSEPSYNKFLLSMGLLDRRGRINRKNTEKLATALVGNDWQWYQTDGKKQTFIRIGQLPAKNKMYPTTAEAQFEMYGKKKILPPKRSSDISSKQDFLRFWNEHQTYQEDDEKKRNNGKSPETKKDNLPSVVTPSSAKTQFHPEKELEREKVLNILGRELLSKLFDESSLKHVVDTFRSSLTVDEVLNCVANTHIQVREERQKMIERKKIALIHATQPKKLYVDPSSFPYLLSKEIDVQNTDDISRLLREVSTLQKEVVSKQDNIDIFKFLQGNDKKTTLIRVPTNTTRKHFEHNLTSNHKGYNFVYRILDAMLVPSQDDGAAAAENHDDGTNVVEHGRSKIKWTKRIHSAEGMIVYLGKKFGAAFVNAANILGMPVVKTHQRMNVPTSAAMCDDAGLSNFQKRIINKYTIHTFGHPLTAPEQKMKLLAEKVILPICGEVEVEKERCPFMKKDVVEVIEKKVQEATDADPTLQWDRLDIILGGDHGQGAFRVPVKLLLKDEQQEVKVELEYNIGEVECKKDTSEVLRGTIFPYLNERIKQIIKYDRDPTTNEITGTKDGTIYEYRRFRDDDVAITRFSFQSDVVEGEELVKERPITFIVTGDLAFYAVILGMKNASPFHCHLCLLKKTEWEKRPLEKGNPRTMQWILNNWQKAKPGKGGRVCGVIERPLLEAVDPSRFVVPPLHSMLGVANSILNDFKIFIDLLLEDAPTKLNTYRNSELLAEKAVIDKGEEITRWGAINGAALAECHEEKEELLTLQHSMLVAGEGTNDERNAIKNDIRDVHERLASLHSEREALVAEEALLSIEWKKKKARLAVFLRTKDGKRYIKPVKARFEKVLRKFGIDYAAYHGGDLVGNDCRILMGRAEEIMKEVKTVLLAVAGERRKKEKTKDAITSRCHAIRDALVVFDSVFAIVNLPNSKVVMERDLPQLNMLLEKGLLAWCNLKDENERGDKNITPKVHGLLQHLPEQFKLYGGLGDYDEQFVERNHQTGRKDKLRGRNMRDPKTRFKSFSYWEEQRKNRGVITQSKVVFESRKRNFKGDRKPTSLQEASRLRDERRQRIIENIETRDLSGECARVLAKMELASYDPEEEEIEYDHEDGGGVGGTMEDDDDDDIDVLGGENI